MKKIILSAMSIAVLGCSCSSVNENIQNNGSTTRIFSMDQLYPTNEKPPMFKTKKFFIAGTIDTVIFKEGVFRLVAVDSVKSVMMFDPINMKPSELKRLSSVLVPGNKIKCVATKSDPGIYEMLSAEITEQGLTN